MDQRLFGKELTNLLGEEKQKKINSFLQVSNDSQNKIQRHSFVCLKNQSKINKNKTQIQVSKVDLVKKNKLDAIWQQNIKTSPQMVPIYFQNILHYLKQKQQSTALIGNYLINKKKLQLEQRNLVINWLSQLHFKYKMFPQTIFTVVALIDRYLSKVEVSTNDIKLVGAASFYLAAKYQQTYQVPQLKQLTRSCMSASSQQILQMQAKIAKQLDFKLITNSSFTFFDPLSRLIGLQQKNYHLCQYVLQLSFMHPKFLVYAPSLMASSCIYLIKKIRKSQSPWSQVMTQIVGYQEEQLRKCARDLCHLLEDSESIQNFKAIKRKFSLPCFHEVTRIRLQRKSK